MKHDDMAWSPQLEEDCVKLLNEGEAEGDVILVTMARVSRICHETSELYRHLYDNPESSRHASLHIQALKSALEGVRGALSEQQRQHSKATLYTRQFRSSQLTSV
jgi:hypothetical protein